MTPLEVVAQERLEIHSSITVVPSGKTTAETNISPEEHATMLVRRFVVPVGQLNVGQLLLKDHMLE